MNRLVGWALAAGLCAIAQMAAAQDRVYRCGADGRSYSQEPCAEGRAIEVDDSRSARQMAQAQQVVQRDARLADALARQRMQAESAASRQGPVLIGSPARVAQDSACRAGSPCPRFEHPKRRRDKAERVTLYRAPEPR
jgi:hypothetical protein